MLTKTTTFFPFDDEEVSLRKWRGAAISNSRDEDLPVKFLSINSLGKYF
jgi:hypothetical protein